MSNAEFDIHEVRYNAATPILFLCRLDTPTVTGAWPLAITQRPSFSFCAGSTHPLSPVLGRLLQRSEPHSLPVLARHTCCNRCLAACFNAASPILFLCRLDTPAATGTRPLAITQRPLFPSRAGSTHLLSPVLGRLRYAATLVLLLCRLDTPAVTGAPAAGSHAACRVPMFSPGGKPAVTGAAAAGSHAACRVTLSARWHASCHRCLGRLLTRRVPRFLFSPGGTPAVTGAWPLA